MPQQPATSFDDDLKKLRESFDADLMAAHAAVEKGEAVPHPVVAKLLDWLPAVTGAAGGVIGAAAGAPAAGVGAIPGAVAGAAIGGATGEAWRQLGNRFAGNPAPTSAEEAAQKMGNQVLLQGGTEAVGGLVAPLAGKLAPALMQSALKPGIKHLKDVVRGKTAVPRVVQTLLDEGVNVTPAGLQKVNDLLDATNDEIAEAVKNSKGLVFPEAVAARAEEVATKFGPKHQVAPSSDLEAVQKTAADFMATHTNSPMLPAKPLTVAEAQTLKKGTYKAIGSRAYGETKGAAVETEKALARGLKEDIESAVAKEGIDIKALNRRDSALMEAQEAIGKRVAMAANRDPAGLGWIAENPKSFMAFVLSRSPAAKSMVARGLYQSASKLTKIPENLIRLGITALASHNQDDDR